LYFASYHGHSIADGHAASIKRVIRSEYNTSQLQRFNSADMVIYWRPANAQEMGRLLQRKCGQTQIMVFPERSGPGAEA
jgi:hypothetical protein